MVVGTTTAAAATAATTAAAAAAIIVIIMVEESNNNNNNRVETITLILSGNGPNLTCTLQPVLRYEKNVTASVALSKISFYASFENISSDKKNNALKIKPGKEKNWILVKLKNGAYDVDDICNEIVEQLSAKGIEDVEKNFHLQANPTRLRAIITLSGDYQLSFDVEDSIANVLGFERTDLLDRNNVRYEGPNVVQINTTTGLFVLCDIARASYRNGKHVSYIYKTTMDTKNSGGVRFIDTPSNLVHVPLLAGGNNSISDLTVWIVDQDLQPLNMLANELEIELNIRLHHHKMKIDKAGNPVEVEW